MYYIKKFYIVNVCLLSSIYLFSLLANYMLEDMLTWCILVMVIQDHMCIQSVIYIYLFINSFIYFIHLFIYLFVVLSIYINSEPQKT